jgi:hypothetical protein|tara:strand:+ start:468 stop:680 length:213 start_codon:yes stop_codon:yes gene_type:complete
MRYKSTKQLLQKIISRGREADLMLNVWDQREKVDPLGWYTCPKRKYLEKAKALDEMRLTLLQQYRKEIES